MSGNTKVLITSTSFAKVDPEPAELLVRNGCDLTWCEGPFNDDELSRVVGDAEAVIVGIDRVGHKTIRAAAKLRVIAKNGTGVDNIDVVAAAGAGIKVVNAPSTNAVAVAEYVFAGLLCLARKIVPAQASLKEGKWEGSRFMGFELNGKTLGVVGMGHIGQAVARIGKGFNMRIMYFDVQRHPEVENELGAAFVELGKLLTEADIVTLHVPLGSTTRNLISARELEMMKPTAYLVNLSRGEVVNEEDLYEALVSRRIQGAVLDVFSTEPLPKDWPILGLDNVLCTPHLAGYTYEASKETSMAVAHNLLRALSES